MEGAGSCRLRLLRAALAGFRWRGRPTSATSSARKAQGAVLALLPALLRLQRPERSAQPAPLAQREHRACSIERREQRHRGQGAGQPQPAPRGLAPRLQPCSARLGAGPARFRRLSPGSLYMPRASRGLVAAPGVTPPLALLAGRVGDRGSSSRGQPAAWDRSEDSLRGGRPHLRLANQTSKPASPSFSPLP